MVLGKSLILKAHKRRTCCVIYYFVSKLGNGIILLGILRMLKACFTGVFPWLANTQRTFPQGLRQTREYLNIVRPIITITFSSKAVASAAFSIDGVWSQKSTTLLISSVFPRLYRMQVMIIFIMTLCLVPLKDFLQS